MSLSLAEKPLPHLGSAEKTPSSLGSVEKEDSTNAAAPGFDATSIGFLDTSSPAAASVVSCIIAM